MRLRFKGKQIMYNNLLKINSACEAKISFKFYLTFYKYL